MVDPRRCRVLAAPVWLCGLLAALALCSGSVSARSASDFDEVGRFYVQNLAPQDYGASHQNWAFVQDERGLIYVGNGSGVLEYDGVSWRLIPMPNQGVVRSLAIDSEGRIFVGAKSELGYLVPDALGRRRYVSLVEQIPGEDRDFADVWQTFALPDGVYFHSYKRLFRWQEGQIEVWRPETSFYFSYAVGDTFYVQTWNGELLYMDRDTLRPAPGGTTFVGQRIAELVPHGADAYLAVTRKHGLMRCRDSAPEKEACVRFSPGLKDLLGESELFSAAVLDGGILALGTIGSGVVLLDRDGHLLRILNEASGLRHNIVWSTYVDRQGWLWLGLNDGLARVNVTTSLSYFDKTTGLLGTVTSVARHRDRLHVATTLGIFVLEPAVEDAAPHLVAIPGVRNQCWSLVSTSEGLLAGCHHGVYDVDQRRLIWPYPGRHVFSLHRSRHDATRLYVGLEDGLAYLSLDAGAWHDAGRFENIRPQVLSTAEDDQGRLWLGTSVNGALRLEPASDAAAVSRFGANDGLAAGWIHPKTVAGQLRLLSKNGLFRRDSQAGSTRFVPDTTFLPLSPGSIAELAEDEQGRVWIAAGEASGVARPAEGGGYTFAATALRRVPNLGIEAIIAEPGAVWIGGGQGLLRLGTEGSPGLADEFPVWIRRVTTATDTSLYEGPHVRPDTVPSWPYRDNALRFTFAAPRYDAPERTVYRTRLDGFSGRAASDENDWSAWTGETYKEYTNLWEGHYVFRVEARDVYGAVSREDTFAFRILPPWYRTWWAYSLYGLALAVALLAYARSHREELRRERAAAERERAVSAQLREVDKLKDEFLANTSHELRTPLYGITGLAESLIDGAAGELPEAARAHLSLLVQSGHRLSVLVNDILDYSKLEHRSLEVTLAPVDLHALTDVVLTLSAPLAADKGLKLANAVEAGLPPAHADTNRVQQILHNLVGNAIKYTDSGRVEVSARRDGERLEVSVRDTGIGIADAQLEQIFEPFVQTDATIRRRSLGTGLGLALSKQLVELHGGTLRVESVPGEGSVFSFTVPVGPQALTDTTVIGEATQESVTAVSLTPVTTAPIVAEVAEGSSNGGGTILAVDDEPIVRQVLKNHLVPVGYRVLTAASGPEALELLDRESVDLVLLDIMMPGMSGYEVCRRLRQKHSIESLPILFLSAMNRTDDRTAALDLGGNDYIAKPVAKAELLSRVSTHLDVLEAHRRKEQEIVSLRGLLPICIRCKKIRDDEGFWNEMESYISRRSEAEFSHGICPACTEDLYPGLLDSE